MLSLLLTFLIDVLLLPEAVRHAMPCLRLVAMALAAAEVAAPLLAVTLVGVAVGRLLEGRQMRAVQRAMLREGVCPACAYSLRELEPDAEGVTTCAECGGAWEAPAPEEEQGAGAAGEEDVAGAGRAGVALA